VYRRLYTEGPSSCGGATLMVRQEEGTTRLLPGHQLDLVGDPCVVVLRREGGTAVSRLHPQHRSGGGTAGRRRRLPRNSRSVRQGNR
jgi:hypothetical protein